MTKGPDPVAVALAATVNEMADNHFFDPHAKDIASAYVGDDKVMMPEVIHGILKRMKLLAAILVHSYGRKVCLLSKSYWIEGYNTSPPTTMDEARRCLAGGYGKPAVGLWIRHGRDPK